MVGIVGAAAVEAVFGESAVWRSVGRWARGSAGSVLSYQQPAVMAILTRRRTATPIAFPACEMGERAQALLLLVLQKPRKVSSFAWSGPVAWLSH